MTKPEVYKYFADIIFNRTGISYPEKDYYRLDSRINTLLKQYECSTSDQLYEKFRSTNSPEMLNFLIDISTNNETYFFRDIKPFDALVNDMIPEIRERKKSTLINIWSCASSTGQEALSIVMGIEEKFPDKKFNVRVDATDISSKVLDKARSGIYTGLEVQRGLPVQLLVKYFESTPDSSWKVKSNILHQVHYSEFNLFSANYPVNKYDIIFCRNVLIYQNAENKNEILKNLVHSLQPGGYLVMGAGESLIKTDVNLEQNTLSSAMVFRKPLS